MPPRVPQSATLRRTVERIDGATLETPSMAPPPVLLGPGIYTLHCVKLSTTLSTWTTRPPDGRVHVAWSGASLVETWVLFPSYIPANFSAEDGVVVRCVQSGAPGPVAAFLDALRPLHPGAVVTAWSHPNQPPPSALSGASPKRIPGPSGGPVAQCWPGEVEIVATDNAGVPGASQGYVDITQISGQGGAWQAGQFQELWTLWPNTTGLGVNQAALLRRAPPGCPVPNGTPVLLWNVQYQPI